MVALFPCGQVLGKVITLNIGSIKRRIRIHIPKTQVLHYLGYPKKHTRRLPFAPLLDECLREAHDIVDPRYLCTLETVSMVLNPVTVVRDSLALESQVLADLLERCSSVVVFVATIGEHLESSARKLASEENLMRSYIMDAIGSAAVEQVVEHVQTSVGRLARSQGLTASRRFSPGYCDWDVRQQRALFELADAQLVGVHLTDAGLMVPRKSVSGVIGLGPSDIESYNPCTLCDKDNCIGRR
jgi:hypothetical protein